MKLKHIEKIIKNLFLSYRFIAYYLNGLAKRDPNLWCFGTYNKGFSDNSKYLYLYIKAHHPEIRAIWISRSQEMSEKLNQMGFEAYYQKSRQAVSFMKKAKYHITNTNLTDTGYWYSFRAVYVNLWHGLALKRIEFDIQKGANAWKYQFNFSTYLFKKISFPALYKRPDLLTVSSRETARTFKSAFRLNDQHLTYAPLPRNTILNTDKKILRELIYQFESEYEVKLLDELTQFEKVFIWLPTFRDGKKDFLKEAHIDFEQWNEFLSQRNDILLVKMHQNLHTRFEDFSHIRFLNSATDIYPFLTFTDCLITDYSSIYIDYLLLDKPIIFFCFDKHSYISDMRGIYYDYEEVTPGCKCYHFNELLASMDHFDHDQFQKHRQQMKEFFFKESLNKSLSDLLNEIKRR